MTNDAENERPGQQEERESNASSGADGSSDPNSAARRRRRGSRGGQRRRKGKSGASTAGSAITANGDAVAAASHDSTDGNRATGEVGKPARRTTARSRGGGNSRRDPGRGREPDGGTSDEVEMPERIREGRPSAAAADKALVRKPKIGDTRPAPTPSSESESSTNGDRAAAADDAPAVKDTSRRKRGRGGRAKTSTRGRASKRRRTEELPADALEQRRGRERNGRPIGRYLMGVQVRPGIAQVAVLEGRNLIEHYVSRPSDDVSQIHGNVYIGRVQNVLPGMEAAFVDIATPKNAVLYRDDVQYDAEDIEERAERPRIEQMLKAKQLIICQVTKNPIGAKGARLTQEVSLPGRYVVLIPNSKTYGISKRLPDDVRKRLRAILDRVKPDQHGLIVRTAAEHATEDELRADMQMLLGQWTDIEKKAAKAQRPTLLYREPELAVRRIREEFNADYRGVVIDDRALYEQIRDYVTAFNPELADRVEYYDQEEEGLSLFETYHIHEQVHKALDRKVWLPSGGSLIIEHTEALTVIDVNTGKNVGKSSLEETVFRNNLEAAEEVAKQLRLRDIGGIIVIDFIDMEVKSNRQDVIETFRNALARDKTRSQVFDISELGLVEMTRKRIGEGLLTEYSEICPDCEGRGVKVDYSLLD